MSAWLEVRNLLIERGGRRVLEIEHLEMADGEVLAVIGPNGAGKSTLLLALAGLLRPERGDIFLNGVPIQAQGDLTHRRRVALVLQEPLLLDQSVADNVALGLRFRGMPAADTKQRVDLWLERLGIAHLRRRPARQLSGGEAQRVSLARAFALEPELFLLDEPFSALDPAARAGLLTTLHNLLTESGVSAVFITHDLDEALLLGERVAVLLEGQLRQHALPQQVFNTPADEAVAAFVGVETVILGNALQAQDGLVTVQAENGLLLEAIGQAAQGSSVLVCLRPEDITIWSAAPAAQSSARNRLPGRVERLLPQGPLVRVEVNCGFPLVALVTRPSAAEMGLAEGQAVTAAFKASAAHLIVR